MRETEFNKTREVILLFPFVTIWSASEGARILIADDYSIYRRFEPLLFIVVFYSVTPTLQNQTFLITIMSKRVAE